VEARLANIPPCLIGMEACVGAHHLSRKLASLGYDARLMPAKYVRPYSRGQKNDFNDAEAIAEAVQRPTMKLMLWQTGQTGNRDNPTDVRRRSLMRQQAGQKTAPDQCRCVNLPLATREPSTEDIGSTGRHV
jgi:transposase